MSERVCVSSGPVSSIHDGQGARPVRSRGRSFEDVLARAGDGVFAVGLNGHISLWNRAAERMLGWSAAEMLGRPCCEVFAGADSNGNRLCYQGCHVITQVKMGESVQHFEMQTRTKSGRSIWLDISILEAPSGGSLLAVHVFRDLTVTKELLELVQRRLTAPAALNGSSVLSKRELEVLQLMATGANTKALAERLHVSPATIRNHAQNIFAKLDVHSRLEAVAWANEHRLP